MFTCCVAALDEVVEKKPTIVDLKQVVADRAWKMYHSNLGCMQKKRWRREDFDIEVPENYYIFEDVTSPEDQADLIKSKNMELSQGQKLDSVATETKFNNNTGEKQMYSFHYEKNRKSSITVSCQRGFTFGASTHFTVGFGEDSGGAGEGYQKSDLGIPPVGGHCSVYDHRLTGKQQSAKLDSAKHLSERLGYEGSDDKPSDTRNEGETFEEEAAMGTETDIVVGSHSCYTADVKLDDKRVMKPFRSRTRMRLPQGYAPVYIKRKSDGLQVSVYVVTNLKDVFGDCSCVTTTTDQPGAWKQQEAAKASNGGKEGDSSGSGDSFKTPSEGFKTPSESFKTASESFKTANESFKTASESFETASEGFKTANESFKTPSEGFKTPTESSKKPSVSFKAPHGPPDDGRWIDLITEGYVEGTFAASHQFMLKTVPPPDTMKWSTSINF